MTATVPGMGISQLGQQLPGNTIAGVTFEDWPTLDEADFREHGVTYDVTELIGPEPVIRRDYDVTYSPVVQLGPEPQVQHHYSEYAVKHTGQEAGVMQSHESLLVSRLRHMLPLARIVAAGQLLDIANGYYGIVILHRNKLGALDPEAGQTTLNLEFINRYAGSVLLQYRGDTRNTI